MKRATSQITPIAASHPVTDALRAAIVDGRIAPGAALRQTELAQSLGVSHIPVREALRTLALEGFVVLSTNRGAETTSLTKEDAAEITTLRRELEPLLLRASLPRLLEEDFRAAEDHLRVLDSGVATERILAENTAFHDALYRRAHLPRTAQIVRQLRMNFERYLRVLWSSGKSLPVSQGEHRKLLSLCRKRDVDAAASALERHIAATGKTIAALLTPRA